MTKLMVVPTTAENVPKMMYSVPMSLWFVEKSQREAQL
jgi:hypothetical protein